MIVFSICWGVKERGKNFLILSIGRVRFQFSGFFCSIIMESIRLLPIEIVVSHGLTHSFEKHTDPNTFFMSQLRQWEAPP